MVWRAYIEALVEPATPTDSADVKIRFEDAASVPIRTITRQYKLIAGISRAEALDMIRLERTRLRNFENVKTALLADVGTEAT